MEMVISRREHNYATYPRLAWTPIKQNFLTSPLSDNGGSFDHFDPHFKGQFSNFNSCNSASNYCSCIGNNRNCNVSVSGILCSAFLHSHARLHYTEWLVPATQKQFLFSSDMPYFKTNKFEFDLILNPSVWCSVWPVYTGAEGRAGVTYNYKPIKWITRNNFNVQLSDVNKSVVDVR